VQRLVVALTTLLSLTAAVVLGAYLFVFAAQPDRAARAVPADTAVYATLYLQPSTGQKLNLAELMSHVPGFADSASLDTKIHEITARFLGQAGIDYEADVRPWLGDQVALSVQPDGVDPEQADVLVVIDVRDRVAADAALDRIAGDLGLAPQAETHEGVALSVTADTSWALLEDVLLVGSSADAVRGGLDADAGRIDSLADSGAFADAMAEVAADHLASMFVDLEAFGTAAGLGEQLGGYRTASLALLVEPTGLRVQGSAPFDAEAASDQANEAFALSSEPSSLGQWMPASTQAELVVFGLSQSLQAIEDEVGGAEGGEEIIALLTQLRVGAAFGLGINLDADVLPLLDRETALAISGLEGTLPTGQLLLRPSDPDGAAAALERIRAALVERGAASDTHELAGTTVTSVAVPELGTVSYAISEGVVVLGLRPEDVETALTARTSGTSLAADERYTSAWELAGDRGGNEIWLDVGALVDAAGDELGVTGEARDILLQAGALAMTAPARPDEARSDFHVVLTVR
jgi:hypothetical protein